MRVIDCNQCGETIRAANDEELVPQLTNHMKSDHPELEWDDEQATDAIAEQAYSATDS